jgi:hypothetical protein
MVPIGKLTSNSNGIVKVLAEVLLIVNILPASVKAKV